MKYRIYWTNFGYYSQDEFTTLAEAIAYGKSKCFEFQISHDCNVVASWSPIGGLRTI
jgi:hypothetical protein